MGARTSGREAALQMLFALDVTGDSAPGVIARYWSEVAEEREGRPFADELVLAVSERLDEIDGIIRGASKQWRLERMARVDRNVLRLGVAELLGSDAVPRAVILDEAVELAKRFGADRSSEFVNGVLDRIAEDLGRS